MSLRPDDRSSRSRSHSRSKDRSRSRSNVRPRKAATVESVAESEPEHVYSSAEPASPSATHMPAMPGGYDHRAISPGLEARSPTVVSAGLSRYFPQTPATSAADIAAFPVLDEHVGSPLHERPGFIPMSRQLPYPLENQILDDGLAYGMPQSPSSNGTRPDLGSMSTSSRPAYQYRQFENVSQYQYAASSAGEPTSSSYTASAYAAQKPYQYAQLPEKITYTARPQTAQTPLSYTADPQGRSSQPVPQVYPQRLSSAGAHIIDITPGAHRKTSSGSVPHRLSVTSPQAGQFAPPSPGLNPRIERLSVSGNRPQLYSRGSGGLPPPSPLLEPYHGTYQSISPMATAMMLNDDEVDELPPLSPTTSRSRTKVKMLREREKEVEKEIKKVKLYDAQRDALDLNDALKNSKIDVAVICDILPVLTHDQMLELRKEYKKYCKIQGRGINISKHLKMKVTGNFGKAAYVTALGRWESEGYWANFWYQSHASRRELLIESLMGRSNDEIRQIKDSFRDKRYGDSLTRCMEKELKMDKFRTAILMVLEERRQEEQDSYPIEYRNEDVDLLRRALKSREGGESTMLEIIVRRSDTHLRYVLKTYEKLYGENFARAALKKSNNLVGEVIAHILNGVINRPARDALLLRHAIRDIAEHNRADELRYELLISRLVRLHWDKAHLAKVKREYGEKYGSELVVDVEEATGGDLGEFLFQLCR